MAGLGHSRFVRCITNYCRPCLLAGMALVLLAAGRAPAAGPQNIPGVDGFLFGFCQGDEQALPYLKELGIKWARVNAKWRELEPELKRPGLELEDAVSNPGLLEEFSKSADWSKLDHKINILLENGIQPIPIVGHGYSGNLPDLKGKVVTPDRVGRDHYLALVYLVTRAVVERYDGDGYLDAPGARIKLWQIENEPNQAGLTAGWGWRDPKWVPGLFSAWADWDFMTSLIKTLNQAVKDADPQALTFTNFHTDVPPKITRMLNQPDWLESVRQWAQYTDIIGFDAYPNYYSAAPVRGDEVGGRVKKIRGLGLNKPVIIVEIDYPSGPEVRGFSAEKQAEFIRQSFWSAYNAGASGYIKFSMTREDSTTVVITPEDIKNLDRVVPMWENDRLFSLLLWAVPRAGYVQNHFLDVVKSVEGYWGIVGPEGNKKPGFEAVREIQAELHKKSGGK